MNPRYVCKCGNTFGPEHDCPFDTSFTKWWHWAVFVVVFSGAVGSVVAMISTLPRVCP